ncbi:peptidoglycan DD-metalloendopeptidase family protein, partial [Candidatus Wolfebacteria bacterium]|nr:peptidoglycan DD-metalloendopeptidase family protein [Candidatus Wolfebacteria bacterium]
MQNHNSKFKNFTFYIVTLIFALSTLNLAAAADLKGSIDRKTQELLEITDKINENQKILDAAQGQSRTLKGEIKKINSNINQVNLSIKSSELTIDKLELEVDSLRDEISDAEKEVSLKEKAVAQILREFQKGDDETPFMIFLKNKSLADSVFEMQNLADLSNGLSVEINSLKEAKGNLSGKLGETSDKKQNVQVEKENLKNKQIILSDTKSEKQFVLTQTKNQEKVYQQTLTELQKRQAEIASEIEVMDEELRLKIDPSTLPSKRPGVLARPVSGAITQEYGATAFAKYGYAGKWHNGLDFAASIGTPIYSAEKGTVIAVGNSDKYCNKGAYGKFVVVKHENNLTTLYSHLSLQKV